MRSEQWIDAAYDVAAIVASVVLVGLVMVCWVAR